MTANTHEHIQPHPFSILRRGNSSRAQHNALAGEYLRMRLSGFVRVRVVGWEGVSSQIQIDKELGLVPNQSGTVLQCGSAVLAFPDCNQLEALGQSRNSTSCHAIKNEPHRLCIVQR